MRGMYVASIRLENEWNAQNAIAHFTVAGENEAGVDLVLIQPFLLYYVNHVFLMLTSIFKAKFTL